MPLLLRAVICTRPEQIVLYSKHPTVVLMERSVAEKWEGICTGSGTRQRFAGTSPLLLSSHSFTNVHSLVV